jgi:hypothetical protein
VVLLVLDALQAALAGHGKTLGTLTKKLESEHVLVPNLVLIVEAAALPKHGWRVNVEAGTFRADTDKALDGGVSGTSSSTWWSDRRYERSQQLNINHVNSRIHNNSTTT